MKERKKERGKMAMAGAMRGEDALFWRERDREKKIRKKEEKERKKNVPRVSDGQSTYPAFFDRRLRYFFF